MEGGFSCFYNTTSDLCYFDLKLAAVQGDLCGSKIWCSDYLEKNIQCFLNSKTCANNSGQRGFAPLVKGEWQTTLEGDVGKILSIFHVI